MLYRSVDKSDGSLGKWLGVGGKHVKGESADACFMREAYEETGIRLTSDLIRRRGIVDFLSESYECERMFLYTANVESDYFAPDCNEGNLKWIPKSEILDLSLWEGDKFFLTKLINEEPFFVMSLSYGGRTGDNLKEVTEGKLLLTDISSLSDENLKKYTGLNENQLKHIYEPDEGVFIAETAVVIARAVKEGLEIESLFAEHYQLFDASTYDYLEVPLYSCAHELMCTLTGYNLTHGFLAVMNRKPKMALAQLLEDSSIRRFALLEDVMNPTNVGAIVRSAAALSVDALLLTKGCADPLYRRSIRVSMGNIFTMPYSVMEEDYIKELKNAGVKLVAMALSDEAYDLGDERLKDLKNERVAIIFGTESTGISDGLLKQCDYVVKIPMSKEVDSLNVAAASAVAFWEMCVNG